MRIYIDTSVMTMLCNLKPRSGFIRLLFGFYVLSGAMYPDLSAQVELTLHQITDASGIPNTASPGAVKTNFTEGETVRVTLKAMNLSNNVDVRVLLNIRTADDLTIVYDSDPINENSFADSPLETGETDYYSFDWVAPVFSSNGFYDIAASIRNQDNFLTVYDTTIPGPGTGFGPSIWLHDVFAVTADGSDAICAQQSRTFCNQFLDPGISNLTWHCVEWADFWNGVLCKNVSLSTDQIILHLENGSGAGAHIETAAFLHYGRYTAEIKADTPTIAPQGFVQGFFYFWQNPDSLNGYQEIDVEILSAKPGYVYYTVHSNSDNSVSYRVEVANPTGFNEYGFDWQSDQVAFLLDGETACGFRVIPGGAAGPDRLLDPFQTVCEPAIITNQMINIPDQPGNLHINMWSGSAFAGDAPQGFGTRGMHIKNVQFQPAASPLSFSNWFLLHFPSETSIPETECYLLDPDADNLSNSFEYLLGTDPNLPDAENALNLISADSEFLYYTYRVMETAVNVNPTIQWSETLSSAAWQSNGDFSAHIFRCHGGSRLLQIRYPLGEGIDTQFMRLQVTPVVSP